MNENIKKRFAIMEGTKGEGDVKIPLEKIYESASETAKKIRKTLKAKYPNTKFSVTSETYSMGSSVTVRYKSGDEPDRFECSHMVGMFSSATFDSMTDSTGFPGYEYEGKMYHGAHYVRYAG